MIRITIADQQHKTYPTIASYEHNGQVRPMKAGRNVRANLAQLRSG